MIRVSTAKREVKLIAKGKSSLDKGKKKKEFGPQYNSIERKIQVGDQKFLKNLGWTREEARAKLKAWKEETKMNARSMERWYHESVEGVNHIGNSA